jgi:hypothetical protein
MKTCKGPCGRILPATAEYFYKHSAYKDGLVGKCRTCTMQDTIQPLFPSTSTQIKHYVYALCYPDDRVFYIGKGTHHNRIDEHEREARRGKTHNSHKVNVIRKIWADEGQVKKKILACFATDQEACMYETALIFGMRPYGNLTNITDGGEGLAGLVKTEEHIRKVAEAITGRIVAPETRLKWSQQRKGKKPSPDAIRKRNETMKGYKHSEAAKQRISQGNKGKKRTEEHIRKMKEERKKRQDELISANPNLCTVEDTMQILGISKRTVFRRIDAGELHPIQTKPYVLLERTELECIDDTATHQRQGNLRRVAAKHQKLMTQELPRIIAEIRQLIDKRIKPTRYNCRAISNYSTLCKYMRHNDLVKMAKEKDSERGYHE